MKWQSMLTHGVVVSMLAGCGGGARDFSDAAATSTSAAAAAAPAATASPSSLELAPNVPNVSSDAKSVVTVSATIKDANNVALQGQPVSFSTADAGSTIVVKQATTDAGGRAAAEVTVSDRSNRAVTVRATAGSLVATTSFAVTGTTLQLNGPRSAQISTPVSFTATIRDASGAPLANVALTAASARSVALSLTAPRTDAQGQVVIRAVAPSGGDTITVSGGGAQAAASYTVSTTEVAMVSPTAAVELEVNSPHVVQFVYRRGGAPIPGVALTATATRGVLTAQVTPNGVSDPVQTTLAVLTDNNGVASFPLRSRFTGSSLITVTAPDGTVGDGQVEFVSSVPAQVELQPSPAVVSVNLAGTEPQSSALIAVVRDSTGNPVRGARVDFTAVRDPSSGRINPAFAVTDNAGVATTNFFAGPNATGPGVDVTTPAPPPPLEFSDIVLRATVFNPNRVGQPIFDDASLTAKRRELQVRIGTGNTVLRPADEADRAVYNDLPYGVVVTDSAGNPARNVTVQASVVGLRYLKGTWERTGAINPAWRQQVTAVCPGEDVNRNLRLDLVQSQNGTGEDSNGDGELTPGNVATVYFPGAANSGAGITNEAGSVAMNVRYPRDRGGWVEVLLRVTAAMTGGTEGATEAPFVLLLRDDDIANPNVSPPGVVSPYGALPSCTNNR